MDKKIFTVTELTRQIKKTLEQQDAFTGIWLKGEIYNLTYHSSGHIYFTLKDENALISVTFFKYANRKLKFRLEEGMSIFAFGNVTVFEKRGSYQFNVSSVKIEGEGELQKKIEQLRKKLSEEGVFDPEKKKDLPFLPRRVGVVTSPTGAAIQDIIKVALRRYPSIEIILAPAKVQGDDAAPTIVTGIRELNRPHYGIDVIIAGRGGGSFEDLMPFNEEPVVRAFAESTVPIISAVGHQIDHPLSDDAADAFAPTPSAAAEIAIPVKQDLTDEINFLFARCEKALATMISMAENRLDSVMDRRIFRDPIELIASREMLLREYELSLLNSIKMTLSRKKEDFLTIPDITRLAGERVNALNHRYNMALQALEQLSPLQVMKRGYAVIKNEEETLVRSVTSLAENQKIKILLADGSAGCRVESINKGDTIGKK